MDSIPEGLRTPIAKSPTHIHGLDAILQGGLPNGRTTVVAGGPGSGKTVLGLEFLYRGALSGEPGLYIGFEEPAETLRQNAATLGWDLSALEGDGRLALVEGFVAPDALLKGSFSFKGLLAGLSGKAKEMGARRVVFDALEVLLRLLDNPVQVRAEIYSLIQWVRQAGLTAVMTVKPDTGGAESAPLADFFDSLADCVIRMDARILDQVSIRRLRVIKYRGSDFGRNEYPYVITDQGIHAVPVSMVSLDHKPLGPKVSTGLDALDEILDGGFRKGSCVLFAGLPGTGKTLMASTFCRQATGAGQKVLYVSFEESEAALLENIRSAGLDLTGARDKGALEFLATMPEAMGAEEHLVRFLRRLETICPDHVVVDAISACPRMGGTQAAFEYLMRLINACKERGITVLLTNQTTGTPQLVEISGNGISSMVDTVIFMNYVEGKGETNRVLQVLKTRGSGHSNQRREYVITANGIRILDVYLGGRDVLTGTARRDQEAADAAAAEKLAAAIRAKQSQVANLEARLQAEVLRVKADLEQARIELEQLRLQQQTETQAAAMRRQMRRMPVENQTD